MVLEIAYWLKNEGTRAALSGGVQFALFGLLTAILAFKRPYLTLDVWVRRSPHDRGLPPAMWALDWFNVGLLISGGFFPRSNQFCHAPTPDPTRQIVAVANGRVPLRSERLVNLAIGIVHRLIDGPSFMRGWSGSGFDAQTPVRGTRQCRKIRISRSASSRCSSL